VEIGKRGIKDHEWVRALGKRHHYHIVDWGETAAHDPALIGGMLERLVNDVRTGAIAPLPRHVFSLDEVERAFRFMAKARHAGKIVVRHGPASDVSIRRDGTYLVTGGLSGLGLAVAQWLAERGAGRLVLVGRRGLTAEAAPVVNAMRTQGTTIVVEAFDVTDETGLAAVMARIRSAGPPLRGVVHSAGVLEDAGLLQQDATRFERVSAPKVRGGYLLDVMTRTDPLDFFVLFSSAAAVLGSAGQSNHAAANAVLDTLARERRNRGVPALSIDWGPWKETGAAAVLGITERLAADGLIALSTAQGLFAFERSLQRAECQVTVLPIDWHRFQQSGPLARSRFLSDAVRGAAAQKTKTDTPIPRQPDLRQQVLHAPVGRWRDIVEAFVTERVLRALGLDPARAIDPRTPLGELGLDSLLAIELRNALARSLDRSLPATLLFDYPTLDALTGYVMCDVLELEGAAAPPAGLATPVDLVGSIEELADDEVDRLLAARAKGRA
jgi:NAD(P)-dependent dehydrogenase (short-subunit alcohol dehydrogenase family)/acyl carrier protein